jgi:L-aspartate oxidase
VVGGGLAGLYAVLHLPADWDVVVVDKGTDRRAGSSPLAQGGMAVPMGSEDSPSLHASDTVRVGAGACNADAVEVLTNEARDVLDELVALGCEFDRRPDGSFDLNREGGQTVARSVHREDATGRELMRVVVARARQRAKRVEGAAIQLLVEEGRCIGALVRIPDGDVTAVSARCVLLASGGCGGLYEATTNTLSSTGDGVALAYAAGATVADVEFVQFHPTTLAAGDGQRVLLTEALRGEGALVVDRDGERFLFDAHPDGELAPRDVVARAIAATGEAFLDARALGAEEIERRFPNVAKAVRECGFDLATQPVPISPAAHYFLGGVATDLDGRTTLPGLYAAGECAATGVHGANRMAGNSLTEAVVFGRRAAAAMTKETGSASAVADGEAGASPSNDDEDGWRTLRRAMSEGAGLVRSVESLRGATVVLDELAGTPDEGLRLAVATARLICEAALRREESRGVHFRSDHPATEPAWDGRHIQLRSGGDRSPS